MNTASTDKKNSLSVVICVNLWLKIPPARQATAYRTKANLKVQLHPKLKLTRIKRRGGPAKVTTIVGS